MNAVGRIGSYISRGVYTVSGPFHPFGGCVDIIVVEQQDGTFKSSPWYVRFGKFQGVLKTREKVVKICVNGSDADFHMFLDHKGEAHFLREIDVVEEADSLPISDDDDAVVEAPARSLSCRFDSGDGKALARTNSRRARILGLVFGRGSPRGSSSDGVGRADSLERAEFAANLLEVKWSTNLDTTNTAIKGNSLRLYDSGDGGSRIDGDLHGAAKAGESVVASECDGEANVDECGGEKRFAETEVSECGVSDEDGTESFIYCESSESSIVRRDNSSEQTHETVYIATGESGELRVRSEVVCARTKPTLEDTVVEHYLEDYELEALPALASAGEDVSQDIPAISGFENLFQRPEEEEKVNVDVEEEQLLFGNIDDLKISESPRIKTSFLEEDDKDKDSSPEVVKELHGVIDKSDISHSPSEKSPDFDISTGNLTVSSDPIAIMGACKVVDEEVGRLTESLPNLWAPTDSFSADGVNCLSHSLDSNSKPLIWSIQSRDNSSITKMDGDQDLQLESELPAMNNTLETGDSKDISSNPAAEMSLCKHLFFQGMGSDAASQAFDAEKLDLEKFNHLGPEVVKDNKLVVRINDHYYPWDVAAPIVLGMVSFGNSQEFEPKGMISVDKVEKPVTGNWRLWPFSSFKKSRSQKTVPPSLSDLRNSETENASEVKISVTEDSSKTEPKVVKKLVKVLRPTSEQLASLGLKEGRNTVTFTFLTPMLGKQQVDCRIYLWKWNTRIVISDVDGTITRSDVLGQFMPLVGVDWSHLGVAHLFSAIKENGYQLLFLSARAISQAYITRQFLFNLKQDGKALPDGPVVISPDGLFPSLYREVIRRAPHEFKISCLEEIRSLFPPDCNPFYAGFGNRDTDEISYLKVGIPKGKIFIINPKGEVAVNRRVDTKSYKSIHALVNGMFPSTASSEQEDYNSWNFWKLPPPLMDV